MGAAFLLQVLWLCAAGCSKNTAPPPPLPVDQLPAALEKAFAKAKPDPKELANQIVASLQAQDYARAYTQLQNLLGKPGLTKEQISVTTRGSLSVNTLLQAAQASGDTKAAATLKAYRINK